jgi:hypothetical protein
MTWPWIVLLGLAVALVLASHWSGIGSAIGVEARRKRERERRKAKLRVVRTEDEEFVASVQRDLDRLPTVEEREPGRRDG